MLVNLWSIVCYSKKELYNTMYTSNHKKYILSRPIFFFVHCTHAVHSYILRSQIDYDQGFMYDVSLQIESEFNGDIKSIVPAEHKRHRRK